MILIKVTPYIEPPKKNLGALLYLYAYIYIYRSVPNLYDHLCRNHLDKNCSAFIEETDSDVDIYLDDIIPSAYDNVINHIQTVPRVVSTWINQENNEMFKFEISINFHNMYLNYLKKSRKNKQKVNKKQYKKIYNRYIKKNLMV